MTRLAWTDERLDERMAAIDQTFDRIFEQLALIRGDIARLDDRLHQFQNHMVQVGFGLVAVLIAAITTIVLALA
jgi:DNA anti-recombination protein RmuC